VFRVNHAGGIWVATSNLGKIGTSTNGTSWTQRTSPFSGFIYRPGYGAGLWVVGNSTGEIATSTDGIDWALEDSDPFTGSTELVRWPLWAADQWVIVGGLGGTIGRIVTAPWAAEEPDSYYLTGVIRDANGDPCARTVRLFRRSTGALLASTTSHETTGVYEFAGLLTDAEVVAVAYDDEGGTLYNDLIGRVIPGLDER
jgi:hypothetical protein